MDEISELYKRQDVIDTRGTSKPPSPGHIKQRINKMGAEGYVKLLREKYNITDKSPTIQAYEESPPLEFRSGMGGLSAIKRLMGTHPPTPRNLETIKKIILWHKENDPQEDSRAAQRRDRKVLARITASKDLNELLSSLEATKLHDKSWHGGGGDRRKRESQTSILIKKRSSMERSYMKTYAGLQEKKRS